MLTPSNNEKFLHLLKEAVLKNTVRPRPEEEAKMTVSKAIRCSPEIEGDSQLGSILFIGIAHWMYRVTPNEIMDYLGVEQEEFSFKINKFLKSKKKSVEFKGSKVELGSETISQTEFDARKFANKVKLINNYVRFFSKDRGILYSSAATARG